jgi:hypothetical protein
MAVTGDGNGSPQRVRRRDLIGGAAFRGVVIGLSAGIAMRVLGQPVWSAAHSFRGRADCWWSFR